jgi:plasmid stabilization system protein ParE
VNAGKHEWIVRLSHAATADFHGILRWTEAEFGSARARRYELVLTDAIDALTASPRITGSRPRSDLLPGLFLLHVARNKHKGRHILLYHPGEEPDRTIEILRVLYDFMDFAQHLPKAGGGMP